MRVLLDTEVLVQAYLGERLSSKVPEDRMRQATSDLQLTILPFSASHAYRLFSLPKHHRDPFDRMIIATALAENIPVISGDRVFRLYKGMHLIW